MVSTTVVDHADCPRRDQPSGQPPPRLRYA